MPSPTFGKGLNGQYPPAGAPLKHMEIPGLNVCKQQKGFTVITEPIMCLREGQDRHSATLYLEDWLCLPLGRQRAHRPDSGSLCRLMTDQSLLQLSELPINTIHQGINRRVHFSRRGFRLHTFPVNHTDGFCLMLQLLNAQDHLNNPDFQFVPIQPIESCLKIPTKCGRHIHVAASDS
jgi:hypothetical protein